MSYCFLSALIQGEETDKFDVSVELARGYIGIPHDGNFLADEMVNAFFFVTKPAPKPAESNEA